MTRILLVDDDKAILDAVETILKMEGYTMRVATGRDSIKKAQQWNPHLILLDILLDGADGRDIANELRNNSDTREIPIVMLSANPSLQLAIKPDQYDAFLSKPFGIEELINVIRKLIKQEEKSA